MNIINKHYYIGSTIDLTINNRIRCHFSRLKHNNHHSVYLQRSYNKYGINVFVFGIIEEGILNNKELLEREQYYIDTLNPQYNICKIAGNSKGTKQSDESNKRRSETLRRKFREGIMPIPKGSKGRIFSEDTRRKQSIANKGKIITAKHRYLLSICQTHPICVYLKATLKLIDIMDSRQEAAIKYKFRNSKHLKDVINTKYGVFGEYIFKKWGYAPRIPKYNERKQKNKIAA